MPIASTSLKSSSGRLLVGRWPAYARSGCARAAQAAGRSPAGFTLIELMVTVAVVAILAALAIPAYSNYIIRSHLPNATNGLSAAAAQMEQFFQDYRSYAKVGNGPQPPCMTAAKSGDFIISCLAPTNAEPTGLAVAEDSATTYVIVAEGSKQTAGFYYTIDNLGNQTSVAGPVWGTYLCSNSWTLRPGIC